mmetsp:Transcript_28737/g.51141  ORF Transcript_28737/g.51141 Transcript_28737/m.51141 type:complete len:616 (-) Transcript_28737:14-1861(-)
MSDEDYQELRDQLTQERLKVEQLVQDKKEQERNFTRQLHDLQSQLEAEHQKNLNLSASYMQKESENVAKLESLLSEAKDRESRLLAEIQILREEGANPSLEGKFNELEAANSKLAEENRQLISQQTAIAEAAFQEINTRDEKIKELNQKLAYVDIDEAPSPRSPRKSMFKRDENRELRERLNEVETVAETIAIERYRFQQEVERLTDELNSERTKLTSKLKQVETQSEERAQVLQELVDELEAEVAHERAKLSAEYIKKAEIFEEIGKKDSRIAELQDELSSLRELLQNKEVSLEKLEEQIQMGDSLGMESSAQVKELQKQNTLYITRIRELERKVREDEESNRELAEKLATAVKAQKAHSREKEHSSETISSLRNEVDELKQKAKEKEDKFTDKLNSVTVEFTTRITELKRKNFELENSLEEIQDSMELGRQSIFPESLGDEFNQIEEYRPSRFSIAPRQDNKQAELLQIQLNEKDAQLKLLQSEKESYTSQAKQANAQLAKVRERYVGMMQKKEIEAERLRIQLRDALTNKNSDEQRRLEAEVAELKSEVEKMQTQLKSSGQSWASENNSLRLSLFEAEQTAVKFKLQFAEASTDRDIYMKKYQDMLRFRLSK